MINKLSNLYRSNSYARFIINLLISIVLGFLCFLYLFGSSRLSFSNVSWIYAAGGDTFQHQIGWEWFRQEPWHFPLGHIDSYGYPFGTSLSFLDSIPLLAIPCKLFSHLFTQQFQYLGLWVLMSLVGMLFFGMLLLNEFGGSFFIKIIGSLILVISPPLLYRAFFHDSLTAQWILLAAIWLVIREYKHSLWRGSWVVLFSAAMLIHLYFVVLIIPLWGVSLIFHYKNGKKIIPVLINVISVFLVLIIFGYCLGLFSLRVQDLTAEGFGKFSWNLNGFINSMGQSLLFRPTLGSVGGQYEGFSYLGLGNIVLIITGIFLYFRKDCSTKHLSFFIPLLVISLIYILYALSNKAYLNSTQLWSIKLPEKLSLLFSMFRSSGRFIWPVFYLLVLFGLISNIRNLRFSYLILIFALGIQLLDTQPLYLNKRLSEITVYKSPLQSEFWEYAALSNEHIVFIPGGVPPGEVYEPIALYARTNLMTLNTGYFSRADYTSIDRYAFQIWEELKVGRVDSRTIYIFWNPDWESRVKDSLKGNMLDCHINGYHIYLSRSDEIVKSMHNLANYCVIP